MSDPSVVQYRDAKLWYDVMRAVVSFVVLILLGIAFILIGYPVLGATFLLVGLYSLLVVQQLVSVMGD